MVQKVVVALLLLLSALLPCTHKLTRRQQFLGGSSQRNQDFVGRTDLFLISNQLGIAAPVVTYPTGQA